MLLQLAGFFVFCVSVCVGSKTDLKDWVFALSCIIESLSNLEGININPFLWQGALWGCSASGRTQKHTGENMPRFSSSAIFSILGKVAKRCFAGFDLRALRSLVSTEGECNKVELDSILQIQSIVRLYLHTGMFYNSSGNSNSRCKLPHDRETHTIHALWNLGYRFCWSYHTQ